jgi:glycosyltransferase involved in cell wall biosynthesis
LCAGPLSDHIIAPSRGVADTLAQWVGAPLQKIEVVHHGFDLERLDPSKVNAGRIRSELGLEGKIVFGAIGRVYALKNYPALLEAFAAVAGDSDELRLVIVGSGDLGPLRLLAGSLGVESQVVFCGPRDDVPELLAACDAFVHPAIAESFGMVIVEAMAMARPVLSTAVGIAPDVIEPLATGFLSPTAEPSALAALLQEALEHRSEWHAIGAAARRRVEGFTARAMASRYEELYVRWLRESERRRSPRSDDGSAVPMKRPETAAGPDREEAPPVA